MATGDWYLPSSFTRIKSWAAAADDIQTPWKDLSVEINSEALCSEKTSRTGF